jgi:hypothetical protein
MSSMQFSAWEASELDQDIRDEAAGVGVTVAPEDDPAWQAFLDQQAQEELDWMYDDPAFWAYLERQWSHYPEAQPAF